MHKKEVVLQHDYHTATLTGLQRVLSPKTGIVKSLGYLFRNPGDPTPHVVTSAITAFHRFSSNKADFASTGTSTSQKQAHWSAMGESVERYCAALSDFHDLTFNSYDGIVRQGLKALAPRDFTLFREAQYNNPDFPFAPPTPETRLSWIQGQYLQKRESVFVPSALVFNQYHPVQGEIRICPDIHPGVASGFSGQRALTGAMLEIVERDTMMIHWLNNLPVTGITEDADLNKLRRDCGIPPHLDLHLAWLQTDLGAICIFALLLDWQNGLLGGGCSAGFSARRTAQKATCEAIQILHLSREVQRGEQGKLAGAKGGIPKEFLSPVGRKKLPLTELLYNLGYYLDPDNWKALHNFLHPANNVSLRDCDSSMPEWNFTALKDSFANAGLSPICVNLTTPDVADIGWLVFRVLAPGAVPNLPTLYPPEAVSRLQTVPRKLGFDSPPRWNAKPMPYA